jgi:hypothetical protein
MRRISLAGDIHQRTSGNAFDQAERIHRCRVRVEVALLHSTKVQLTGKEG